MASKNSTPLEALNPFMPGAGLQPPELVGRERDIEAVDRMAARTKLQLLNQGIIFSGLRGMGKTVLLITLQQLLEQQHMITVRMEATGNVERDYETLFHEIAMAVSRTKHTKILQKFTDTMQRIESVTFSILNISADVQLSTADRERSNQFKLELLVTDLANSAKAEHTGIFFFIDELQEMNSEMLGTLITLQHKMGQESLPFYIIGAGLPNLPGKLSKTRSYAERLFEYRQLGALSTQDATEGFQKPAEREGRPFDTDALDELVALSSGYPYFIQAYGKATWNASKTHPIHKEAVEIGAPIARKELDDGLYTSRWQRANQSGRNYLLAMAQVAGDDPCATAKVAEQLKKEAKETSVVRTNLINLGLIYSPEYGKVAFTVPGMGEFILRTHPVAEQTYDE